MRREIAQAWVAALESGKYGWCESQLHDGENGWCCLGVLGDVLGVPRWQLEHAPSAYLTTDQFNVDPADIPVVKHDEHGLIDESCDQFELARLNDMSVGFPIERIREVFLS